MMEELETPTTAHDDDSKNKGGTNTTPDLQNPGDGESAFYHDANSFSDDIDSSCSTPYVSAPSSPGRGPSPSFRYFYSAPSSPMHFLLASSPNSPSYVSDASVSGSSDFEFSAKFPATSSATAGAMSSADELFLNGQIRPMKLPTNLRRPPSLAPLLDEDENENDFDDTVNEAGKEARGRDSKLRDRSIRRTRSMSPLRNTSLEWYRGDESDEIEESGLSLEGVESKENESELEEMTTPSASASASRSSSAGRSSKRWVFLKDLLYRSKSEGQGRNNGPKFWSSISFSPVKDRKLSTNNIPTSPSDSNNSTSTTTTAPTSETAKKAKQKKKAAAVNGVGKKRVPASAHELHYTAKRAQAEEMRKKTYLPYRQGLLGCLGFSSKSYGAVNGFARALNPVSSR